MELVAAHVHLYGECPVKVLVVMDRYAIRIDLMDSGHNSLNLSVMWNLMVNPADKLDIGVTRLKHKMMEVLCKLNN